MAALNSRPGKTILVTLTAAAVSGVPFLQGTMALVPITDGAIGDVIACHRTGMYLLEKVDGVGSAWTLGAPVYWDVVADAFTYTDNTAANPRVGTAGAPAADGDVEGWVILGQF
jgi:predicted RecA/RadA family phage recombinase